MAMESRFVPPDAVSSYEADGWRLVQPAETRKVDGDLCVLVERPVRSPLRWATMAAAGRVVLWVGRLLVLVAELTGVPGRLCLKAGGRLAARAVELRAGRRFG